VADFQRPPTAQEAVLAELRARILHGDIAPGTPLRQEDLAASLGVSRVPVREALRMLESEGHVTYLAHRGYRVAELDLDDLEEIYHLRALIEDDLAARSMTTMGSADLTRIRAAFDLLAAAEVDATQDPGRLAAANRAFHWAILRPAPRVERILATLWDASDTYRARWFADPGNVARGAHAHRGILAAVEHADADEVVRLLSDHRAGAVRALREALAGRPQPAGSASS
jgi:DNA-binding GntR family transcriptional regulator